MTVSVLLPFVLVLNIFSCWDYQVILTLPKIVNAIAINGISDLVIFVHILSSQDQRVFPYMVFCLL